MIAVEFQIYGENMRVVARVMMPTVPLPGEMVTVRKVVYTVRGRGFDIDPGSIPGSDGDVEPSASAWVTLVPK